jgi:hypothetical protein
VTVRLYHEQPGVRLWLGDCREVAASIDVGAVGLVLADPPYGTGVQKGDGRIGDRGWAACRSYPSLCAGDGEPFDPAWLLALDKPLILWGANHFADRLLPSPSWLVWDKREGMPSNDFADAELAWSNLGGSCRLLQHLWSGAIRKGERQPRIHPMQKPVALMKWCLSLWLQRGGSGTVFDPYAGSGPVARACLDLGIPYVGCDVEEWCCETIVRHRLGQQALPFVAAAEADAARGTEQAALFEAEAACPAS